MARAVLSRLSRVLVCAANVRASVATNNTRKRFFITRLVGSALTTLQVFAPLRIPHCCSAKRSAKVLEKRWIRLEDHQRIIAAEVKRERKAHQRGWIVPA